jgi:hypothetical protein
MPASRIASKSLDIVVRKSCGNGALSCVCVRGCDQMTAHAHVARPGQASKVPLVELEGGVAHQPVVAQQQRLTRRPIAKVHQVCSPPN